MLYQWQHHGGFVYLLYMHRCDESSSVWESEWALRSFYRRILWTSARPSSQGSLPPTQQAHPHCGQLTKLPQKEHFISICLSLAVHPHKFSLRRNGKQIGTLTHEWLKRHSGCASGAAGYQSVCRSKQSVCFIIQCDTGAECARPAAGAVHQREH